VNWKLKTDRSGSSRYVNWRLIVKNLCRYESETIEGETILDGVNGRTIDMTVTINDGEYTTFSMKLACNDEYETSYT